MDKVISVSQLNEYIRRWLDDNILLSGIMVSGEISGYKLHSSGHIYFNLKDESSVISCVFYRGDSFRLKFVPRDGLKVVVTGRPTLYSRHGKYQFVVKSMQEQGSGDLAIKFEELKNKLLAEGLFDSERKKKLPFMPKRIGVVTSQTGAVFHDILNVTHKRAPQVDILLSPVPVQGVDAPEKIVKGLELLQQNSVDVIIIGRGGGSAEELSCFNDEGVVRAVAACEIPIISAVGHETDTTLCDLAADVRAATPSQAAEFAVPDVQSIMDELSQKEQRALKVVENKLMLYQKHLENVSNHYLMKQPEIMLENAYNALTDVDDAINLCVENSIKEKEMNLAGIAALVDGVSPLKVLARGYGVISNANGKSILDSSQLNVGEALHVRFHKGSASVSVTEVQNEE